MTTDMFTQSTHPEDVSKKGEILYTLNLPVIACFYVWLVPDIACIKGEGV
jgi:hypothetical protein